jgi:hypothetical protein
MCGECDKDQFRSLARWSRTHDVRYWYSHQVIRLSRITTLTQSLRSRLVITNGVHPHNPLRCDRHDLTSKTFIRVTHARKTRVTLMLSRSQIWTRAQAWLLNLFLGGVLDCALTPPTGCWIERQLPLPNGTLIRNDVRFWRTKLKLICCSYLVT